MKELDSRAAFLNELRREVTRVLDQPSGTIVDDQKRLMMSVADEDGTEISMCSSSTYQKNRAGRHTFDQRMIKSDSKSIVPKIK